MSPTVNKATTKSDLSSFSIFFTSFVSMHHNHAFGYWANIVTRANVVSRESHSHVYFNTKVHLLTELALRAPLR